jgi:membrane-associated phospholipid phosphatase
MRLLLKKNRYFLIPYVLFLLLCGVLILVYSKAELHILSNKANGPFWDVFFKYATHLGDGAMIGVLTLILLFIKYRYALAFLAGSLVTSVVVNLLKKVFLGTVYRPSKYFELYETFQLHLVDGVKLHALQSFPSGHTATAFNLFFTLALLTKSNSLKLIFFLMAVIVGYSRVYLSQHFLQDIAVGSLIGVIFILLSWIVFEKFNKNWLDRSILK